MSMLHINCWLSYTQNRIYMVRDVSTWKGLGLKSLWHCNVNLKPSSPLSVPYSLDSAEKFSITYKFLVQLCKKLYLYGTSHWAS